MSEDLRSLSWFDVERRLAMRDVAVRERDYTISQQFRTIESLRSELRAAQDSLAKLEAKKESEPLPTWTPPASLPDGEYLFWNSTPGYVGAEHCWVNDSLPEGAKYESVYRDWTDPHLGRWQVKDGKATYLGEA